MKLTRREFLAGVSANYLGNAPEAAKHKCRTVVPEDGSMELLTYGLIDL